MNIIVIGATGTIGSEVVKARSLKKHEVSAPFFAAFESNALTRQSFVVSHGWSMQ